MSAAASNIFRVPLQKESAHDGIGLIEAARIADRTVLASECNFIDYAVLPPGTSIGDHRHADDEEEFYLVLQGSGTMRLESEVFEVGAGDLVRNPPGGLHGLANGSDEVLKLFIFETAVRLDTP